MELAVEAMHLLHRMRGRLEHAPTRIGAHHIVLGGQLPGRIPIRMQRIILCHPFLGHTRQGIGAAGLVLYGKLVATLQTNAPECRHQLRVIRICAACFLQHRLRTMPVGRIHLLTSDLQQLGDMVAPQGVQALAQRVRRAHPRFQVLVGVSQVSRTLVESLPQPQELACAPQGFIRARRLRLASELRQAS